MKKVNLDDVLHLVSKHQLEPEKKKELMEDLEQLAAESAAEKSEKKPRSKKEMIVVVRSHKEDLCSDDFSLAIFQTARDGDPEEMLENIKKAAVENNIQATKAKNRVNNFNEVVSHLKPKWLKQFNVGKPAKEWLRFVFLDDSKFDSLSSQMIEAENDKSYISGEEIISALISEDAEPVDEFVAQED